MDYTLYQFITSMIGLFLWNGELLGEENIPEQGPAVFIANHLDATGPIAAACSLPVQLHPWVVADMMDRDLAPAWLQKDFTERQLHLKPPYSAWLAQAISRISLPLFHSLGCIPVYRGDLDRMQETLVASMEVLRQGGFILVYPEDNLLPIDPQTRMSAFQHSFVRLGEVYHAGTGKCLRFIPTATHASGFIQLGTVETFNPFNPVGMERRRLKGLLERAVQRMYLELDGQDTRRRLTSLRPTHPF